MLSGIGQMNVKNPSKNCWNTSSLIHYDPKQDIVVASDASDTGGGAVILHKFKDEKMKAIMHVSWILLAAEKKSNWERGIDSKKQFHEMMHGKTVYY